MPVRAGRADPRISQEKYLLSRSRSGLLSAHLRRLDGGHGDDQGENEQRKRERPRDMSHDFAPERMGRLQLEFDGRIMPYLRFRSRAVAIRDAGSFETRAVSVG